MNIKGTAAGGGQKVSPGIPLPKEYTEEKLALVEAGLPNLLHHLEIVKTSGMNPVVCINAFPTDTKAEIDLVKKAVETSGARVATSNHWARGGEGAQDLADAVIDAAKEKPKFKFFYPLEMKLRQRVEKIAKVVYGADGVAWAPEAESKAKMLENNPKYNDYSTVMVKTHLSLSYDPTLKGVPKGWTLPVRDILIFSGAKFLCPLTGAISLMPGTASNPAFRRVDIDTKTGKVRGLF